MKFFNIITSYVISNADKTSKSTKQSTSMTRETENSKTVISLEMK